MLNIKQVIILYFFVTKEIMTRFFISYLFKSSCGLVEPTRNLLASKELRKTFGYTWLKSGDVGPNVARQLATYTLD